jgi:hypothetical protein
MRYLLALALVFAACDQTPLEVPSRERPSIDGRWVSAWVDAGQGEFSTRYVLEITEAASGRCTAMLSCQCSSEDHIPENPGNRFWEGERWNGSLTMTSTNLVTGETASLTASLASGTLTAVFSWSETVAFARDTD